MKLKYLVYALIFAAGGIVALLTTPGLLDRGPPAAPAASPAPSGEDINAPPPAGNGAAAETPAEGPSGEPLPQQVLLSRLQSLEQRLAVLEEEADERRAEELAQIQRREEILARREAAATGGEQLRTRQVEMLVDSGFSAQRAETLLRRADELRYQSLQQSYLAMRGEMDEEQALPPMQALRNEIGDAEYDRFLFGLGQPNRVAVSDVFQSSPAATAGLRPGDVLYAYDGQRLFSNGDLRELSMASDPGQNVVLDVLRDGQIISVYLPGGPLGVQLGARRSDPDD